MIYKLLEHRDSTFFLMGLRYEKKDDQVWGTHHLVVGFGNRPATPNPDLPASTSPFEGTLGSIGFAAIAENALTIDSSYTNAAEAVEINNSDLLPPAAVERIRKLRLERLDAGFKDLGYVRVNAAGDDLERLEEVPDLVFSWLLTGTEDPTELALRKGFLRGVFADAGRVEKLGFRQVSTDLEPKSDDSGMLPDILMDTGAFKIMVNKSIDDNMISPVDLEGAGEVHATHGFEALLMMLYLQKRWRADLNASKVPLVLCDPELDVINYTAWEDIKPLIDKAGWDEPTVRSAAERLGLVSKLVSLKGLSTSIPSFGW